MLEKSQSTLREGGGLRPETIQQLEKVAEANSEVKGKKTEEEDDDDFDYSQLGLATKDIIANKARRDAIEKKIKEEMNFEDLIVHSGRRPVTRTSS